MSGGGALARLPPGGYPLRGDQEKDRSELIDELGRLRQEVAERAAELRNTESRCGALTANASDLIFEFDDRGRLLFVSPSCASLGSRPLREILGKTLEESGLLDLLHQEDRRPLFETFREGIESGQEARSRFRLHFTDDSWHWFEGVSTPFEQADGSLRVIFVCRDVTDVVRARRGQQDSESLYRFVADLSRDMILETNSDGELIFISPSVETLLGYSEPEWIGTKIDSLFDLVHPDDREGIFALFNSQSREPGTTTQFPPYRYRHKDGRWIWFSTIGACYEVASGEVRYLEVTRDITDSVQKEEDRLELTRQMQEAQRLESLGVMAGGITHDFNNLLTPILGDAELALLDLAFDSPIRPRIEQIRHAAQRAAALTRQLLAYSGQGPVLIEPLAVSRLVEEMGQLLEGAVSGKAALIYDLADDLPSVEADVAQLSQVVMNLITNATEAVREGAGRITLRTGIVEAEKVDRRYVVGDFESTARRYVFFEVVDDGCGMDLETRSKIFDPFFRDAVEDLRPVLHDQIHGAGSRPCCCPRHRAEPRRLHRNRQRGWTRNAILRALSCHSAVGGRRCYVGDADRRLAR